MLVEAFESKKYWFSKYFFSLKTEKWLPPLNLHVTYVPQMIYEKNISLGVWFSHDKAYWETLFEMHTPSEFKVIHRV